MIAFFSKDCVSNNLLSFVEMIFWLPELLSEDFLDPQKTSFELFYIR